MKIRLLGITVLSALLICLLLLYLILWESNTSIRASENIVTIPKGAALSAVADSLTNAGVLVRRWSFIGAGKILGLSKSIHYGKYQFESGLSNSTLLKSLSTGESRLQITVVIPEGWRKERIAKRFEHYLGIDQKRFLELCREKEFIKELGLESSTLEGYLMPETYKLFWQTDERDIIQTMVDEFKRFYVDSLQQQQERMRISLNDVLTLASIVEAETALSGERARVAGVYLNRLRKGMKLQADPTVQYIVVENSHRLTYNDLRINSAYNTYLNYGLPPGPIGNPGRSSILGVLYPENHSYYYFVANGQGGHRFSKTLDEHQRAVRSYRKIQRQAAQSSKPGR
ncbi:MAG: endolytic transglycosylase MltG [bacterium]